MAEKVFSLLEPRLQYELAELGFQQPTPIQTSAIPRILAGESVLLIAPTGHGKTEAAFLPLLHGILTEFPDKVGVLVLWVTPLRALNRDILRRLVLIAERLGVKAEVRHGDTRATTRRKQALQPPTIFVTTPETLQALLVGKRMRENLRSVLCVVIDEVHELAASKRGVQLMVALERLRELTQTPFQRIGLSATVGNPKAIAKLMTGGRTCKIIESPVVKGLHLRVEYQPYTRESEDAPPLSGPVERIWELIMKHHSTLIFANERQMAEALAMQLAKTYGDNSGVHHGSLSRSVRVEAERRFKTGEIPFLVCTSSMELGLDIGTVDLVVQFGSPRQVIRLLQRIGRSGHQVGAESNGIIVTTRFDDVIESVVIAMHAFEGHLERPPVHNHALDILAHQMVGLTMEYKAIPLERVYKIIRRATPYHHLEPATFNAVLEQMARENLIVTDGETLRPRRASYPYYFENLSVIPDIPYQQVINLVTRRPVGRLDAGFAEEYGHTGNILVLRGRPWEVVKQENNQIFVTPATNASGKIPRWIGELIPVSRTITEAVGQLWQQVATKHDRVEQHAGDVEITEEATKLIHKTIDEQLSHGFLPDNHTIYIEEGQHHVVVHCCFGTRINETLARLLAALVTTQLGIELTFYADHYRILFRFERRGDLAIGDAIAEGLKTLEPIHMKNLLQITLLRSPYFGRRFLHVARRFGIVSRDADLSSKQLLRLMRYFTGTPVLEEALREFFIDKLDLEGTRTILDALHTHQIQLEIVYTKRPSPFARQILSRFGEFLEPPIPERFLLEQTRKRLTNRQVRLVCLHCGQWSSVRTIKLLDEHPQCLKCSSRLIAGVFPTDNTLERAIRRYRAGMKLTPEEAKALRKGRENANVVLNYGKIALIAMAGRGIGPTVAKRILAATHGKDGLVLYRQILESEKQFLRTREWWADEPPS